MVTGDAHTLIVIQDALGQAGLAGDGRLSGGLAAGALDQVPQPGSLLLTGSILRSLPLYVRVTRDSNQTINSGGNTPIVWTGASSDKFGMWNAAAPGVVTAQYSGLYVIFGQYQWAGSAAGVRTISLRVNGTVYLGGLTLAGLAANQSVCSACLVYLNENDTLELIGYQNSGGALDVITGDPIELVAARVA